VYHEAREITRVVLAQKPMAWWLRDRQARNAATTTK
jgi:hypothetical protein